MMKHQSSGQTLHSIQNIIKTLKDTSTPPPSTSGVFNLLIDAYTQSRRPQSALFYLRRMFGFGLRPSSNTFNNLLLLLNSSSHLSESLSLFRHACSDGRIPLDARSFNIIISRLCDAGQMAEALRLKTLFRRNGGAPNVVMYTTLIDGHSKGAGGSPESARQLFGEMRDLGLAPNEFTYTAMMNVCFRKGLRKEGMQVYEEMKSAGVLPNLHTFNSLMTEHARGTGFIVDLDPAFRIFDEMRQRGFAPNVVTFNILIGGLCRRRMLKDAQMLVERMMRKEGLRPTIVTYNLLMDGFCKAGRMGDAVKLCDEMKAGGVCRPTVITYNVLIAGFCRRGDLAGAASAFKEMKGRGLIPSRVTYTILVDALARDGDTERAMEMHRAMERCLGIRGDGHSYGALIHGLCRKGDMKTAVNVFRSMWTMMKPPNNVIYDTLIHGYCGEGSSFRAVKLMEEMRGKGMVPNAGSYALTIRLLRKEGKYREAEELLHHQMHDDAGFSI